MAILSDQIIKEGLSYIENRQQEEFFRWCERNVSSLKLDKVKESFSKPVYWDNKKRCIQLFVTMVKDYNEGQVVIANFQRFAVKALVWGCIIGVCVYSLKALFLGML